MTLRFPSRTTCTFTIALATLVATTIFAQQAAAPASVDQQTAVLVSQMISKFHISQKSIDDKISAMFLKRFLKELDPSKLYFLQADVDQFERYRDHLDDLVKAGKTDFAYETFGLYRRRLEERVAVAHKLIDAPHDFTLNETMSTDAEKTPWAATEAELNERWRKRIKFELLSLKLDDKPIDEARKQLHRRYETIRKNAQATEDSEILEMFLSSLAHCFDPHSSYMSPQSVEDFNIQMRLSLEGIGAALRSEDGYTIVAQIVPGGAADKDGRLKVDDKIIAVAQEDSDFVDIIEMKLSRVVRLIRGKGGTKVRLKVINAAGETNVYELVRQKIELKAQEVKGEILDAGDRIPGVKGRIGVIKIPSFYRDFAGAQQRAEDFKSTVRDVKKVLDEFRLSGGVDGILIDLRMNGGGSLDEAVEVSGLFIDYGPVVQIKELDGQIKTRDDEETGLVYNGPLVVLCNRLSASASEIFAGVIKDYKRGIVIGDTTTHGKGTVQNVMPVSKSVFRVLGGGKNLGALKLTINQFYRVNGDSTQNRGVESDVVLPSILDHMDLGEGFLDNALAFDRIQPAQHQKYNMVTPEIIAGLRQTSQARVKGDPKFQELQRSIDRYLVRKNRKSVSLNEAELRSERDAEKAEQEVEKQEQEHESGTKEGPIFPANEYNNEALHVTLDYIGLLAGAKTAKK
jgi:carboxyl-terminal processing protease